MAHASSPRGTKPEPQAEDYKQVVTVTYPVHKDPRQDKTRKDKTPTKIKPAAGVGYRISHLAPPPPPPPPPPPLDPPVFNFFLGAFKTRRSCAETDGTQRFNANQSDGIDSFRSKNKPRGTYIRTYTTWGTRRRRNAIVASRAELRAVELIAWTIDSMYIHKIVKHPSASTQGGGGISRVHCGALHVAGLFVDKLF